MTLTNFERAVRTAMKDGAMVGTWHITDDCVRMYAKELMKAAIKQLRDDGNTVEILTA